MTQSTRRVAATAFNGKRRYIEHGEIKKNKITNNKLRYDIFNNIDNDNRLKPQIVQNIHTFIVYVFVFFFLTFLNDNTRFY